MSTSVTGNIRDLGTTAITERAFVRFWLRGTNGNQARVAGTAVLVPRYKDFMPDSNGLISGTLYSTRDSAGTGNGEIEVGGSQMAAWYGMVIYRDGRPGPEIPIHALNTGSINITSVTPITTNPVVTAPTGDSTYARLDGGNQPFTAQVVVTPTTNQHKVGSSPNQTTLNFPAPSGNVTLAFPNTTDTMVGRATTDTLTNKTLTNPRLTASSTIQDSAGAVSMGVTVKTGSAAGNYTTTSASYTDIDGTNLAATVTVPTGWKAIIHATMFGNNGTLNSGSVCISDGTTTLRETNFGAAAANAPIALQHVFTGDGAAHTFKLRFKSAATTTTIANTSATDAPIMTVTLIPSN